MNERIEWAGECPDCGGDKFLEGPHGGMCVNFMCANPECGSRFNDMGPLGVERISEPSPNKKASTPTIWKTNPVPILGGTYYAPGYFKKEH
jgi:hypothetical protein